MARDHSTPPSLARTLTTLPPAGPAVLAYANGPSSPAAECRNGPSGVDSRHLSVPSDSLSAYIPSPPRACTTPLATARAEAVDPRPGRLQATSPELRSNANSGSCPPTYTCRAPTTGGLDRFSVCRLLHSCVPSAALTACTMSASGATPPLATGSDEIRYSLSEVAVMRRTSTGHGTDHEELPLAPDSAVRRRCAPLPSCTKTRPPATASTGAPPARSYVHSTVPSAVRTAR